METGQQQLSSNYYAIVKSHTSGTNNGPSSLEHHKMPVTCGQNVTVLYFILLLFWSL